MRHEAEDKAQGAGHKAQGLNEERRRGKGQKIKVQGSRLNVQGLKTGTGLRPHSEFGHTLSVTQSASPPGRRPLWAGGRKPKSVRLGLFGGTFNPIHLGHLRAGLEIQEAFALDQVLFIPTAVPPHKKTDNLLSFADRLKMVRLAIAGYPFFRASDIERRRKGKSYSIQTLRYFKKNYDSKAELFFIIGMDAFLEINTWKHYKELFSLTHFVVMVRPGYPRSRLKAFLQKEVSLETTFVRKENRYLLPGGFSVYVSPVTLMDISSTRIRAMRQNNFSVRYLLPQNVEDYILKKDLYAS